MKRNNLEGSDKRRKFAGHQRDQLIDDINASDARNQFAMRVIWLILGAACAVLGWVLLTILLK
jgi:hypothetical protein